MSRLTDATALVDQINNDAVDPIDGRDGIRDPRVVKAISEAWNLNAEEVQGVLDEYITEDFVYGLSMVGGPFYAMQTAFLAGILTGIAHEREEVGAEA